MESIINFCSPLVYPLMNNQQPIFVSIVSHRKKTCLSFLYFVRVNKYIYMHLKNLATQDAKI